MIIYQRDSQKNTEPIANLRSLSCINSERKYTFFLISIILGGLLAFPISCVFVKLITTYTQPCVKYVQTTTVSYGDLIGLKEHLRRLKNHNRLAGILKDHEKFAKVLDDHESFAKISKEHESSAKISDFHADFTKISKDKSQSD